MSLIPDRAPNMTWSLRAVDYGAFVDTMRDDMILITLPSPLDGQRQQTVMTRKDARLLARRLNQCLDETRKS